MIVVDVETSGTEASKHSLVSIGAVDLLKPERQFYGECRIWDGAHIMPEALAINGFTEDQIRDTKKQADIELVRDFLKWTGESENHTVVGQNPFLDVDFIKWATLRNHENFTLSRRTIDIHTVCYFHMIKRGLTPPTHNKRTDINSDFIMNYVGIPVEPKPHIALNGALWEAEAVSRLLWDKNLLPQFEKYQIPWQK